MVDCADGRLRRWRAHRANRMPHAVVVYRAFTGVFLYRCSWLGCVRPLPMYMFGTRLLTQCRHSVSGRNQASIRSKCASPNHELPLHRREPSGTHHVRLPQCDGQSQFSTLGSIRHRRQCCRPARLSRQWSQRIRSEDIETPGCEDARRSQDVALRAVGTFSEALYELHEARPDGRPPIAGSPFYEPWSGKRRWPFRDPFR